MFESHQQRRIALTTSCHDADALPKVAGAGEVVERGGVRLQVMHNGVVVEEGCYYGAWMTEIIRRLRGHHEPQEEAAFHLVVERVRAGRPARPVMVELGSFWAYYSLWFARALPRATLVLVEPDPGYLEVGRRNLELNGVSARFIQAAVGLPDGAAGGLVCESDGVERPATLLSVDGLMQREALEHVDVLLCDTQGAELAMLDGAREALRSRRIRFLVVSTHHHRICGDPQIHERCLSTLRAAGAHVIAEHTVAESFSGDGLIVASTDPRDAGLSLELSRARAGESLFGELGADVAELIAERDAALEQRDALAAELAGLRDRPTAVTRFPAMRRLRAAAAGADAAGDRTLGAVERLAGTVEELHGEQRGTHGELAAAAQELRLARAELGEMRSAVMSALQLALDDEARTRRLLRAARGAQGYERAWQDERPLVSIIIPTYVHWRLLEERALPSALAQTHPDIEVVVVGDAAPPETAAAIGRVGDPRVRYENLAVRGPYPDGDRQRWLVAGTAPMNRAMALARGSWIAFLNDDDALRPDHVATLLAHAREQHAEVAYSKLAMHVPESHDAQVLGAFPPADHAFGWQLALQHEALRLFEFELAAALFDEPGDWHRARRMLRAGVRFSQVDRVTCDYFPSLLWTDR